MLENVLLEVSAVGQEGRRATATRTIPMPAVPPANLRLEGLAADPAAGLYVRQVAYRHGVAWEDGRFVATLAGLGDRVPGERRTLDGWRAALGPGWSWGEETPCRPPRVLRGDR